MNLSQHLLTAARKALPAKCRIFFRRLWPVRWLARRFLGGPKCKAFPQSTYTFWFDGYRGAGFLSTDLNTFDPGMRSLVRRVFASRPPACIWDIGANVGFWSLVFSSLEPRPRQIRCFEPDPGNLHYLRMNRDRNQLAWTLRPVGLSNEAGRATFYSDPETGATGSLEEGADFIGKYYDARRQPFEVEVTTIDKEVADGAEPPDFLKIDVEGHELNVLRGGERTLRSRRPPLMIEITRQENEILAFLRDCGYAFWDENGQPVQDRRFNLLALPREDSL